MDKLTFFFRLFPYLAFLYAGIHSLLAAFFRSFRDPQFNRWEVDEGTGSYVQILGWRKMLKPPQVMGQGHMSNRAACALAIVVGIICVLIGTFGTRHVSGVPEFIPDLFDKF